MELSSITQAPSNPNGAVVSPRDAAGASGLRKALEVQAQEGAMMVRMMEQGAGLGRNVDTSA